MSQRISFSVDNNFSAGLKTEYTGLNFPENAVTECSNTIFTITGEVTRRLGFDYEFDGNYNANATRSGVAIATYRWNNVGGDGETQVLVVQNGLTLFFYRSSNSSITAPLSTQILASTVTISNFLPTSSPNASLISLNECQFSDGNGYLFVYHPYLEPFYCTYNAGVITATQINIKIRDFGGIYEALDPTYRPITLSSEHEYNLNNQGWVAYANWSGVSTSPQFCSAGGNQSLGTKVWTFSTPIPATTNVALGEAVQIWDNTVFLRDVGMNGSVVAYVGGVITINVTTSNASFTDTFTNWQIYPLNANLIITWNNQIGNYPSNSDIWFLYKDPTGVFNPSTTINSVSLSSSPAPTGHYTLSAFNQDRSSATGIGGITIVSTYNRPSTGAFFQGRVWYSGVNASFQATGDALYTTWTENVYFSQVIQTPASTPQFGYCYQNNDPTSEDFFDLLPTDGGVINIQGSGAINKLFPVQNGLLVFADNGIWFITGSTGIGFSATDYTITKISGVQSISGTSFVNLQGFPVFWNEEGIYTVRPSEQGGGLSVQNIVIGTIATFFNNIPNSSKLYVRGDYNPLTYILQWCYRSTIESGISNRYNFDTILNYLVPKQCFYVYNFPNTMTIGTAVPYINDIKYINYPNEATSPPPQFKYLTTFVQGQIFSEENVAIFDDWSSAGIHYVYTSSFTTGYKLHGKAITKWQPLYLYMFSSNLANTEYSLQGVWDYANSPNSGRISTRQTISNSTSTANFLGLYRRHKIRGRGLVFQLQITSVGQNAFDFFGWSLIDQINVSV